MGAWDSGPFDNDTALDWCGDLGDADPARRPGLIRDALATAADTAGYLDMDEACEALAAAAIVASVLPNGTPLAHRPALGFLANGEWLDLPSDLPALGARALDRIMAGESEWRSLWADATTGGRNPAFDQLAGLRAVLLAAV